MMRSVLAILGILALGTIARSNTPPATPVVTEPGTDGQVVNPADVHMECSPFSDSDPGDAHLCTDWEVWSTSPSELVWQTACIAGVERLHTHLGDGVFLGSHAGRSELLSDTDYMLRVRHRDDSGDPGTEWSGWGTRLFHTAPASQIFPLLVDDVADTPSPTWTDPTGAAMILPAGSTPPSLTLETPGGDVLLRIEGYDGLSNFVVNPPALAAHAPVRVRFTAGGIVGDLVLPDTDLSITMHEGEQITIYLPSALVEPGQDALFWVSETGSTYVAQPGQTEPDFSTLVRGGPVPFAARRPGYVVEVVATGFQLPVNIAFVPNPGPNPGDPLYYVSELYGSIKVVTNAGEVSDYATGLLNFNPTGAFPGSGEQGLTGIVVDPDTGDVFACYLRDYNGPHYPRVSRFHSVDGGLTADTETVLLDMIGETQGQSHQISNLSIGPDGRLYVHMGDGFNAATAQNLDSFRGKVLRMNRNGTAAQNNPFFNPADGYTARDFVFAYGLRNPFGGGWRASNAQHYNVENGPSVDRFSRIEAGVNYLWDGSDASMTNYAIYNWDPAHAPTNILFADPSIYDAGGFPSDMWDLAFIAESGPTWATGPQPLGKRISIIQIDADDNLISGPTPFVEYTGAGKGSVVGLAMGPDGLYFTDFYKDQDYDSPIDRGANVLRVRFVGDADFEAAPTSGSAPLEVHFADLSSVPNPTAWHWEFGDGGTSDLQNPTHTYGFDGVFDVRLTVTGDTGLRVTIRPGLIRVGETSRVGFVAGSNPPAASDAAIVEHLTDLGFEVQVYDDDRANRPAAGVIAAASDVVVISSTILSGNVGADFRDVDVPVVFWEQALLTPDRMPLAGSGGTSANNTSVFITNNSHPATDDLATGPLAVYEPGATMSFARAPFGSGVQVLAARNGNPNDAVLVVADEGAALLNGVVAPARRAFAYLEDFGWLNTTAAGQHLFDHVLCWAAGLVEPVIVDSPDSLTADVGDTVELSVAATGSSPLSYTWRRNGTTIPNAGAPTLTLVHVDAGDAGVYDVVVANPCGQAISTPAKLTIRDCAADLNADGVLNFFDLQLFLNLYSNSDPRADFVPDGNFNFFDVQAFLGAFADGCP